MVGYPRSEVIRSADRNAGRCEVSRPEGVVPELIFVVAAYPDMMPDVILQPSGRSKDLKGVMRVVRGTVGRREIDTANTYQKLDVRTEVAMPVPAVDRPAVPIWASRASFVSLISRKTLDINDSEMNRTSCQLVTWSIFGRIPKV